MDSNTPASQPSTVPPASPPPTGSPSFPTRNSSQDTGKLSKKVIIIIAAVGILFLFLILGLLFGNTAKPEDKTGLKPSTTVQNTDELDNLKNTIGSNPNAKASSNVLVYGAWNGQASLIKAVDVNSSDTKVLATLPLEIKKVTVLDERTLLYIDGVDTRDHGKNLTVYDIKDKKALATIPAREGFGIDDYVVSPDKKSIATWEVQFAQGSQVLQGGKSSVYTVKLAQPTTKNLIYDEPVNKTTPVHYPRAILNNGTVFSDTFMANDPVGGAGWAYGMSMSDFTGTTKKEIETMKAGTYGTQPSLSNDGRYLVFSGYDGSQGDGNASLNGFRRAILIPNTIELLNTQTLQRFKLPNLNGQNSYTAVSWDSITGNLIVTSLSKTLAETGTFAYDLAAKKLTKLSLPNVQGSAYRYISQLPGGKILVGTTDDKAESLGNLGDEYAYALTKLSVLDSKNTPNAIASQDSFIQYITILPTNYFDKVLGTKTLAQGVVVKPTVIDLYSDKNAEKQNLQLYTFFLKTELNTTRLKQQTAQATTPGTTPGVPAPGTQVCQQLAESQCQARGIMPGSAGYQECITANREDPVTKCNDSPLYLYGPEGTHVHVTIQTPIHNALPASNGEYNVTLGNDGEMFINKNRYTKIAYDYTANARRITPPTKGMIVNKAGVENLLRTYAKNLGLNEKETLDIVAAGKQKVTSPYVFISFFDHNTSQQILPISFQPAPDNYLNVVFYFRLLEEKPRYTPVPPTFPEPIQRTGFTAVEVSEMVE